MMGKHTIDKLASMQEILRAAIEMENQLCDFYTQAKERARTREEDDLFEGLIKDCRKHARVLENQVQEIEAQLDIDRALSYDVY